MATYDYVDLTIPESRLFADLNGIIFDLQTARRFAQTLIEHFQSSPANWALVEPLSVAIVVTYSRAFSKGRRRRRLGEADLAVLSDVQRSVHDFICEYRNKHAAHSVNIFEENYARAYYCVERVNEEGISSIGYGGGRVVGLSENDANAVIEVTTALEHHLQQQIDYESQRLLALVKAMPRETVLSAGKSVFNPPSGSVGKDRKQ